MILAETMPIRHALHGFIEELDNALSVLQEINQRAETLIRARRGFVGKRLERASATREFRKFLASIGTLLDGDTLGG